MQLQAENQDFWSKYTEGHDIEVGKNSRVVQCQNKDTLEIVAVKIISKRMSPQQDLDCLMREVQINRMVYHDSIEEIK